MKKTSERFHTFLPNLPGLNIARGMGKTVHLIYSLFFFQPSEKTYLKIFELNKVIKLFLFSSIS